MICLLPSFLLHTLLYSTSSFLYFLQPLKTTLFYPLTTHHFPYLHVLILYFPIPSCSPSSCEKHRGATLSEANVFLCLQIPRKWIKIKRKYSENTFSILADRCRFFVAPQSCPLASSFHGLLALAYMHLATLLLVCPLIAYMLHYLLTFFFTCLFPCLSLSIHGSSFVCLFPCRFCLPALVNHK